VIIVVEGPCGAGKTTWCRTHGGPHALLESLPDGSVVPTDGEAAAHFWVERNLAAEVHEREQRDGLVVVGTDRVQAALQLGAPSERVDETAHLAHA